MRQRRCGAGRPAFLAALVGGMVALAVASDRVGVSTRRLSARLLAEQVFVAAVMGVIIALLRSRVGVGSWVNLSFLVGMGGVVYAVVLLVVSEQSRSIARRVVHRLPV